MVLDEILLITAKLQSPRIIGRSSGHTFSRTSDFNRNGREIKARLNVGAFLPLYNFISLLCEWQIPIPRDNQTVVQYIQWIILLCDEQEAFVTPWLLLDCVGFNWPNHEWWGLIINLWLFSGGQFHISNVVQFYYQTVFWNYYYWYSTVVHIAKKTTNRTPEVGGH